MESAPVFCKVFKTGGDDGRGWIADPTRGKGSGDVALLSAHG